MFTHRKINETNERGALMIEAIALLGLMTMMSPMIVRQTADRTSEMEEVAIAGQMKELKDALSNWIAANYREEAAKIASGDSKLESKIEVSAEQLAPYLAATSLDSSSGTISFRGNKLMDGFKVGVRAQCTEMRKSDGSTCTSENDCYTLTNGIVTSASEGTICSRYKMTGIVLSQSEEEIDDRRANRIASMIGADGGYMRTSTMLNALGGNDEEKKKILGAQGIWEVSDTDNYFTDLNTSIGGRVAATTVYSSGFSGDYLYRKKVDGLPDANSMFTDLDMGGATECNAEGACHKINNAGGLEVVRGKILIRSQNNRTADGVTDDTIGTSSDSYYAQIALGTDEAHMHVSQNIEMSGQGHISLSGGASGTQSNLNLDSNLLEGRSTGQINFNAPSINLNATGTSGVNTNLTLNASRAITLNSFTNTEIDARGSFRATALNTAQIDSASTLIQGGKVTIQENDEQSSITLDDSDISMNADWNIGMIAENSIDLDAGGVITVDNEGVFASDADDKNSFSLTDDGFIVDIDLSGDNPLTEMVFSNDGLTIAAKNDEGRYITFTKINDNGSQETISGITADEDSAKGQRIAILSGNDIDNGEGSPNIAFYGKTGRISGTFFQPEGQVYLGNNFRESIVRQRARLNAINENDEVNVYQTNGQFNNDTAELVTINYSETNGIAPYMSHRNEEGNKYKNFRVDPAFISVMNDIKLTSRGGARLSEALPNYILKGIYVLTNSYSAGGWPCDNYSSSSQKGKSNCRFNLPYFTKAEIGTSMGYEHNCDPTIRGNHPMMVGGGYCTNVVATIGGNAQKVVHFDYSRYPDKTYDHGTSAFSSATYYGENTYYECPEGEYCWAHPFIGMVPAPGRHVTLALEKGTKSCTNASTFNGSGGCTISGHLQNTTLYAEEEGPCPDGYQAVLTVTPNSFEIGKLISIHPGRLPDGAKIQYNFGYEDYTNHDVRNTTSVIQPSTRLGIAVDSLTTDGQIYGWRIAMGTVSPKGEDDFAWNVGGFPTNSWSAIAHTYCYYNPTRFTMPNMQFKKWSTSGSSYNFKDLENANAGASDVIITPMDNPLLTSDSSAMID
ncbi:MAG: hypothetical protein IJ752_09200 [Alphaproteobacteria bacterium]|nr:hypothetical protein [Alphaproteobacteria bacterium]